MQKKLPVVALKYSHNLDKHNVATTTRVNCLVAHTFHIICLFNDVLKLEAKGDEWSNGTNGPWV
jgi:hypothetical protein